jgi:hypothetical protein
LREALLDGNADASAMLSTSFADLADLNGLGTNGVGFDAEDAKEQRNAENYEL